MHTTMLMRTKKQIMIRKALDGFSLGVGITLGIATGVMIVQMAVSHLASRRFRELERRYTEDG